MRKQQKNEQAPTAKKDLVNLTAVPVSLRSAYESKLPESGFTSINEGVRTMLRDYLSGRIQYINGILQSQQQTA